MSKLEQKFTVIDLEKFEEELIRTDERFVRVEERNERRDKSDKRLWQATFASAVTFGVSALYFFRRMSTANESITDVLGTNMTILGAVDEALAGAFSEELGAFEKEMALTTNKVYAWGLSLTDEPDRMYAIGRTLRTIAGKTFDTFLDIDAEVSEELWMLFHDPKNSVLVKSTIAFLEGLTGDKKTWALALASAGIMVASSVLGYKVAGPIGSRAGAIVSAAYLTSLYTRLLVQYATSMNASDVMRPLATAQSGLLSARGPEPVTDYRRSSGFSVSVQNVYLVDGIPQAMPASGTEEFVIGILDGQQQLLAGAFHG